MSDEARGARSVLASMLSSITIETKKMKTVQAAK
jgi:hypothetical protein